jgi:hypothetical protein
MARAGLILARQDRIPAWSLPGVYLVIIGVGYFFTFFDIADIGYAMLAINKQFSLSSGASTFVALALVPNYSYGSRLLFVIGGVIATVGFAARFELPESPRWLALHGRVDEADAIVTRMEDSARAKGVTLPEPRENEVSLQRAKMPFTALLARPYLGRVIVLVAMWFFWYIGNYGFLGDAATLFAAHGQAIGSSILYLGIGAIGYPVGAITMTLPADRVERRLRDRGRRRADRPARTADQRALA